MPQSVNALKSAAMLSGLDSPVNLTQFGDEFASAHDGHVPTAFEQTTGDANAEVARRALVGMGGSPSLRALMDRVSTQQYGDAATLNDLASGVPQNLARGEAQVKNVSRDALAAGEFYPNVEDVYNRDLGAKQDLYNAQYVIPATLKAGADLQGQQIAAQGRITAAQAAHPQPTSLSSFLKALQERFANGYDLKPADVAALKAQLGGLQ